MSEHPTCVICGKPLGANAGYRYYSLELGGVVHPKCHEGKFKGRISDDVRARDLRVIDVRHPHHKSP